MATDRLQEKIRKLKNPSVVDLSVLPQHIPPYLLESAGSFLAAYKLFCKELLSSLKEIVPAVRFGFGNLALCGNEGLEVLEELLRFAKNQGFYVLLDGPQLLSCQDAQWASETIFGQTSKLCFDGLILSSYIGSDGLAPIVPKLKETGKDLFVVVRTSNKSAPELQDLLTGSRLVHVAKTDIAKRYSEALIGRCGYSQIGIMAAASSADSLRSLRSKFKSLFLLLDGSDYPNANAKNCSFAFDQFGHGAAACAGTSITAAWSSDGGDGADYVEKAVLAAQRLKKNLTRYVSVL